MQALIMLGLMGFITTIIGVMTSILSQSAMLEKLDDIEKMKSIFSDIEFVVNESILLNNADFRSFDSAFDVPTMLTTQEIFTETTEWTEDELSVDQWGVPVTIRFAQELQAINGFVRAPAVAIVLASPGPDRVFQTTIPEQDAANATYRDLLRLEPAEDSDDIIHAFSTIDAARKSWNFTFNKVQKAASLAFFSYRQNLDEFSPVIDEYYRVNGDAIFGAGTFSLTNSALNTWIYGIPGTIDPIDPSNPAAYYPAGMTAPFPPYPAMPQTLEAFGADLELRSIIPGMVAVIEQGGCTNDPTECKVATLRIMEFPTADSTDWEVNYRLELDGEVAAN